MIGRKVSFCILLANYQINCNSAFLISPIRKSHSKVGQTAHTTSFLKESSTKPQVHYATSPNHKAENFIDGSKPSKKNFSRRSILTRTAQSIVSVAGGNAVMDIGAKTIPWADAAVGTLPEFADTNAVLHGVTVNIADSSQYETMIDFLKNAFDFEVLRQKDGGTVKETWLGFGPEQASIPSTFELPVSSFAMYGGHASIHLRYDAGSPDLFYNGKGDAPGNNIAYLQVGVPTYRISQMVKYGGNVLDAYGFVNVVSPVGLPMRGIVGISPDPMMFVAINTADVQGSRSFYENLGMIEQKYPYARPANGTGQFEPPQPAGSVYLAHSPNNMGVLLIPSVTPDRKRKKVPVVANPVLKSINIVYNPSEESNGSDATENFSGNDPSGVGIAFTPVSAFEKEVRALSISRS